MNSIPPLGASLAYVDGRRQVVVVDPDGRRHRLTVHDGLLWATWGRNEPEDVHSWPAWSPDASRVAAFRIAKSGEGSRVWVADRDGGSSVEIAAMGGRVPIYLQWSPDGSRIAVLSQDDDELVLQRGDPEGRAEDAEILRGSPLFFSWLPDARLAAFVGEGSPPEPSMAILPPDGPRRNLPGAPGNFCAPVPLPSGLAYVAHMHGQVVVLVSSLDGTRIRELERVDGLVALMGSPDGRTLARAISPDGTGSPYHSLSLVDVDTAEVTPLTEEPCVSFFWLPDGDGLVLASRDEHRSGVTWSRLSLDGAIEPLIDLAPSRDTRVWLRFFEQYSPSHPIVDPQGEHLVLCGSHQPDTPARVFLVPLSGDPPVEIDEGLFATFAPSPKEP